MGIVWEFFRRNFFGEIFWEKFFGRIFRRIFLGGFLGGLFLEEFFVLFNVEGVDLFVKILIFVKILSKSKEERISILRSAIASTCYLSTSH